MRITPIISGAAILMLAFAPWTSADASVMSEALPVMQAALPPSGNHANQAPILGLYGEDDARVNSTVPPAAEALRALGRTFETHTFAGAGHGFTRSQEGRDGANLEAVKHAWPLTVAWSRTHLSS